MAVTEAAVRADARPSAGLGIHRAPLIGLMALVLVFLWRMAAHAITVVNMRSFPGEQLYFVGGAIGLFGCALIWIGMKRDELGATLLGYMGGAFIWMGWFETAFHGFSESLAIPTLMSNGVPALTPGLLLMESTAVILLANLIFLGASKETRCRMFLWFHRHFRLRPNKPTPGYRRQFARITAIETVFVSWFMYIAIILAFDPRVLGFRHPVTMGLFYGVIAWGLYLTFFKLVKYRAMAGAVRYAIPTGGILWLAVEMAAAWRWYPEIWVKPYEYPVTNVAILVAFGVLMAVVARAPERGERSEADAAAAAAARR
jgi:hypothetical protein